MMRRLLIAIIFVTATLIVITGRAWGVVVHCVSNETELQGALTTAETNGDDDVIKVMQGIYYGNFAYNSNEGHSLSLLGGYISSCTNRIVNPENTVLDGGNSGRVLLLINHSSGNIFIEGFKIQNGDIGDLGGGVFAYTSSASEKPSDINITHNIFTGNFGKNGGGLYVMSYSASGSSGDIAVTYNTIAENIGKNGGGAHVYSRSVSGTAGDIIIFNNLITGNTANSADAGGLYAISYSPSGASGDIILTNNIVTENVADSHDADGGGLAVSSRTDSTFKGTVTLTNNTITENTAFNQGGGIWIWMRDNTNNIYNNIIWGNTANDGKDISLTGTGIANGYNNVYSNMNGSWTSSGDNFDSDPNFAGIGDYHLQSSSPCIDSGTNTAPEIPANDFEGNPRKFDGNNDGITTVDIGADEYIYQKDLLGTWDGSGVWYRDSEDGSWVKITTPADLIAAGDLDGDSTDDLIGVWSSGLWVKYSETGSWAKICISLPSDIASGDMNGDGRNDLLGIWSSGVYYKDSVSGSWIKMCSTPADLVSAGDIDGDNTDDLIGVWSSGLWVKYSSSGSWARLTTLLPSHIASGDMNGDGRDDVLGTWTSGVWYKDSVSGTWVKMCSVPAYLVTAGDIDGDGTKDLIGVWSSGVWVKYSETGSWARITSILPRDIDAGLFRTGWGIGSISFDAPIGGVYAEGPGSIDNYVDLSSEGPGGWNFAFQVEENLAPQEKGLKIMMRTPGPGEPGFRYVEQKNLFPNEELLRKRGKKKK